MNKILKFVRRNNSNINGYAIEIITVSNITNVCLENKIISVCVDESPAPPLIGEFCFESEQIAKNEFDRIIEFLTNDDSNTILEVKYD